MKRLILSALGVAILAIGISTALPVQTRPQPAAAQQASDKYDGDCTGTETAGRCADKPFDHSTCQYPDRWTNPVDGCDNSDPAVPECIKAASTEQGEKDCIAYYTAQHQPALPVVEQPKPAPAKVSECGGK